MSVVTHARINQTTLANLKNGGDSVVLGRLLPKLPLDVVATRMEGKPDYNAVTYQLTVAGLRLPDVVATKDGSAFVASVPRTATGGAVYQIKPNPRPMMLIDEQVFLLADLLQSTFAVSHTATGNKYQTILPKGAVDDIAAGESGVRACIVASDPVAGTVVATLAFTGQVTMLIVVEKADAAPTESAARDNLKLYVFDRNDPKAAGIYGDAAGMPVPAATLVQSIAEIAKATFKYTLKNGWVTC